MGGGGTIFQSTNGGQTWVKDKARAQTIRPVLLLHVRYCAVRPQVADDLPSNLYKIKFVGNKGYILGSNGVLLTNA